MQIHELPRDLRDLGRQALAEGWEIRLTSRKHIRWQAPSGALVFTSSTPSDWRSKRNTVAHLRKAGLNV